MCFCAHPPSACIPHGHTVDHPHDPFWNEGEEEEEEEEEGEHVQSRVRWSKDRAETEAAEVGEVGQRRRRDRNASRSGIATVKHPFYKTQAEQGQREVTTVHQL